MNWTSETPTQPGYYWLRTDDRNDEPLIANIQPVGKGDRRLVASVCEDDNLEWVDDLAGRGYLWFGPIAPPLDKSEAVL